MLGELREIGLGPRGTNRLAWTPELRAAEEWFARRARETGRTVSRDAAGNLWATPDEVEPPWWGVGSHLDSVRDGGSYDGALGVAAAFLVPGTAVVSFMDEEGARFNTPTFGSRALTGRLDSADALARADRDGVTLADAMRAYGVDPEGLPGARLDGRLRGFVELHIDQGTQVAEAGAPVGVPERVAARTRVRVVVTGTADHAGTADPRSRRDALGAAARLIADALAAGPGAMRRTATRIEVDPNAATTIAARATVWLDARSERTDDVLAWLGALDAVAGEVARAFRVGVDVTREAFSPAVGFDERLVAALAPGAPRLTCFAGHDAAILAPHVPAAMVLVRNPSGISHAPEEHVDEADAEAGVEAIRDALERLR